MIKRFFDIVLSLLLMISGIGFISAMLWDRGTLFNGLAVYLPKGAPDGYTWLYLCLGALLLVCGILGLVMHLDKAK